MLPCRLLSSRSVKSVREHFQWEILHQGLFLNILVPNMYCLCSSNGCNYAWVVVYPKKKDSVLGAKDCPGSCHVIFKVKNDRQTLAIDNIRWGSYEPCQWSLNFGSQATASKIGKSHSFACDGLFGGGIGWRGLGGSAVIAARLLFLPELLSMSKLPCFSHNCQQAAGK